MGITILSDNVSDLFTCRFCGKSIQRRETVVIGCSCGGYEAEQARVRAFRAVQDKPVESFGELVRRRWLEKHAGDK